MKPSSHSQADTISLRHFKSRSEKHLGTWRGLPATGRRIEIPLCGIYTFDAHDRLESEKIYYDRGTVLRQLGVFHEPESMLGKICTLATHPITVIRALARKLGVK